ncbi:uncharacterized protein B0I36DRAFT_353721 [Microdochium trichocladiopsis]|uniref:GDS1 winged helix domain-containing protein n=1 Tax=Microdochium trichocladiopsis TaxID=1682393 RepID=A0A9P9BKA1_9PEZI|nr:uncharacterized protein B0I36DRAFT_353721 [Microdochium trichocladiopsis]KAH7020999.1 hypothetical protein B0I36DRAFT_353721 [Microdochium trichocladiopsis]
MPYNTRRKSLSLPSLGIHIPQSHPRSNKSTSSSKNTNTSPSKMALTRPAPDHDAPEPSSKRIKRSHDVDVSSPAPSSAAHSKPVVTATKRSPPSSPRSGVKRSIERDDAQHLPTMKPIDLKKVNDEIVEAVILRLQDTRNRPQLIKDLSTALINKLQVVKTSANPCSIISSRLAAFMKRSSWSASSPCPLAKELETVHPRRTYYYLTTCPHLPLPDATSSQLSTTVTPSLASSISTTEETESDRRRELSMSPEVDLSSPEFDDIDDEVPIPGTPMGSASGRQRPVHNVSRAHKADEPPLEKDEKEFTQTADGLQKRRLTGKLLSADPVDSNLLVDESLQNETLFGESHRALALAPSFFPHMAYMTSPAIRPSVPMPVSAKKDNEAESWLKLDAMLDWDRSPETVELDELDGLLNGF